MYQVGNPEIFDGNRFFPLTGIPMSNKVWRRIEVRRLGTGSIRCCNVNCEIVDDIVHFGLSPDVRPPTGVAHCAPCAGLRSFLNVLMRRVGCLPRAGLKT